MTIAVVCNASPGGSINRCCLPFAGPIAHGYPFVVRPMYLSMSATWSEISENWHERYEIFIHCVVQIEDAGSA